jgi:hypothetical protein
VLMPDGESHVSNEDQNRFQMVWVIFFVANLTISTTNARKFKYPAAFQTK